MTDEDRWRPDEQLVPALLAGSPTTMADLSPHDRAWAVAAMNREGLTAEAIADRLACSLRLVRTVLADPGGVFARLYMAERENFADELRMVSSEVQRLARELREAQSAADRYKSQLDRMIARHIDGVPHFGCGHPQTKYNTYTAPKTGKKSCRKCHAKAQTDYRQRRAGTVTAA